LVPPLTEDEEAENEMNAREWEAHKAVAIRSGKDNARSRGAGHSKARARRMFQLCSLLARLENIGLKIMMFLILTWCINSRTAG
jgi:hypothetical protein